MTWPEKGAIELTNNNPAPPGAACLRCKQQKVRCTIQDLARGCERCARANLQCLPAPPSRQGKRSKDSEGSSNLHAQHYAQPVVSLPAAKRQAAFRQRAPKTPADLIAAMAKQWGGRNSCADFLVGFFSGSRVDLGEMPDRESILWLLRHWASIAAVRNSYMLLQSALGLAAAFSFPVTQITLGLESSMTPVGLPPPSAVVQCVDALPGFAYARSANPRSDGTVDLYANPAFREHVCSLEALHRCWAANEREMLSLFIHKDDLSILPHETGQFLAQVISGLRNGCAALDPSRSPPHDAALPAVATAIACCRALACLSFLPTTRRVDARLRRSTIEGPAVHKTKRVVRALADGAYVPCHARIKACSVDGNVYFGFFLTPVADEPAMAAGAMLEFMGFAQQSCPGAAMAGAPPSHEPARAGETLASSMHAASVMMPPPQSTVVEDLGLDHNVGDVSMLWGGESVHSFLNDVLAW